MFFDTHTHLGSHQFDRDLPDILARARASGVSRMMVPATDLDNALKCLALAEAEPDVRVAVGIHPCNVDSVSGDTWITKLRELALHPKVAAIGEIGLDYFHAPPAGFDLPAWKLHQASCLSLQLDLAVELGLNVVVHQRSAFDDCLRIMTEYKEKVRGVWHCFVNNAAEAAQILEIGSLVSFTGIVTFKNAKEIQDTVKALPLEAMMVETDCPYLAPVPFRGKRCEPAHTRLVAEKIAEIKGINLEEVAKVTTQNAYDFFRF